jgi:hypothetical protein
VLSFHRSVLKHSLLLYSATENEFNANLQPRTVSIADVVGPRPNSRLLLLGKGSVNIPSQQYIRRCVFYAVRAESI